MVIEILPFQIKATDLALDFELLQVGLVRVHPEHVFLERVREEFALAKFALNLALHSSGMLAHVMVPHRLGVKDFVAHAAALPQLFPLQHRHGCVSLQIVLPEILGLQHLLAEHALEHDRSSLLQVLRLDVPLQRPRVEFLAANLASRLVAMGPPHVSVHLLVLHGLVTQFALVPALEYLDKVALVVFELGASSCGS